MSDSRDDYLIRKITSRLELAKERYHVWFSPWNNLYINSVWIPQRILDLRGNSDEWLSALHSHITKSFHDRFIAAIIVAWTACTMIFSVLIARGYPDMGFESIAIGVLCATVFVPTSGYVLSQILVLVLGSVLMVDGTKKFITEKIKEARQAPGLRSRISSARKYFKRGKGRVSLDDEAGQLSSSE